MAQPLYFDRILEKPGLDRLITDVNWSSRTEARYECFISETPIEYEYSRGRGLRTYTSVPYHAGIDESLQKVNAFLENLSIDNGIEFRPMDGCFLNRYDSDKQHIGWHSDDFKGMDHAAPVCVVSFGEPREIWWKEIGYKGEIPSNQRQLLNDGSLFIMPPGFQHTHMHKIPKGDRKMGPRVSLTFRRFNI